MCKSAAYVMTGTVATWAVPRAVRHSFALKSDGTVWTWGYNGLGNLGDGDDDTIGGPAGERTHRGGRHRDR